MSYDKFVNAEFDCCQALVCPACGANNMHIIDAPQAGCTDDMYKDSSIEIRLYGECGHSATLSMYTHKGSTYARWHSITDEQEDDDDDHYHQQKDGPDAPEDD